MKDKKIVNGTTYHKVTPDRVIDLLEYARSGRYRLRIFYGDNETGRDWCEEYDICGYIGRSTGTSKSPLIVNNARSMGGPALLDHCIVKIMRGHTIQYQHPKYNQPRMEVIDSDLPEYEKAVTFDGSIHARFKKAKSAINWMKFMSGQRLRK